MSAVASLGTGAPPATRDVVTCRPLSVLVVEPEEISRWAFRLLLGRQPWVTRCLPVTTGDEALAVARRYTPDVALISAQVAGGVLATCRLLLAELPALRPIVVDGRDEILPVAARTAGALGIVSRGWPACRLAAAIQEVGSGLDLFAPDETDGVGLSRRERDVIKRIARGATNREIAVELSLSPNTVKQHTVKLYRKLEARNRAEAVQHAQQLGLLV